MFSNLSQNSILYVLDLNNKPKVLSGPIERISIPRPKYNTFNPNMEMVVDIIANINGERREFKGVPNTTIADFGDDAFILAESKDVLNSYVHSMLQNSKNIVNSIEKHQNLIIQYEDALQELNPDIRVSKENDKAIQDLKGEIAELKQMIASMASREQSKTT
jgi:hypothetical protein